MDIEDSLTTRFAVTAAGDWTIEVRYFLDTRTLVLPGAIEGSGDDVILGGAGDDVLKGGKGDDQIQCDDSEEGTIAGADFAEGGDGNDVILGGGGDDKTRSLLKVA